MKNQDITKNEKSFYTKFGELIGYAIVSMINGWWLSWLFVCYFQPVGFWKSVGIMAALYLVTHKRVLWVYSLLLMIATIGVWLNLN